MDNRIAFFDSTIINKIGIAAGFDKNGSCIKGLFESGFGFVEIGTVTPKPQYGNPKPRIFRIGYNEGIINRMGFPNFGYEAVLKNLQRFKKTSKGVVGVNIGRNKDGKDEDYLFLIEKFILDADYITINISSPNTPNLRNMLQEDVLSAFLQKIAVKRNQLTCKKPFFLKISPDVDPKSLHYIYKLVVKNKIEGVIISNTTTSRPKSNLKNLDQSGGLSGFFLKQKSLELLKEWNKINDAKVVVISVGGIETAQDVTERFKYGADFVQVYTSFAFKGPKLLKELAG